MSDGQATRHRTAKRVHWTFIANRMDPEPFYHGRGPSRRLEDNRLHAYTRCGLKADQMLWLREDHSEKFGRPCSRCYDHV